LILDDWASMPLVDEQRRALFEILEDRYDRKSTLVAPKFRLRSGMMLWKTRHLRRYPGSFGAQRHKITMRESPCEKPAGRSEIMEKRILRKEK